VADDVSRGKAFGSRHKLTISVNINGLPDEGGYRIIINRLTAGLCHGVTTATGTTQGTHVSQFEHGSGL
jgi:hypothetical protein